MDILTKGFQKLYQTQDANQDLVNGTSKTQFQSSATKSGGDKIKAVSTFKATNGSEQNISKETRNSNAQNEPVCFNISPPVDLFTGRKNELKELIDIIEQNSSQNILKINITGVRGIGKTELVRQFIEIYGKNHYENLIWINSENETERDISFAILAMDELQIQKPCPGCYWIKCNMTYSSSKVFDVLSERNTLMIFDNVKDITVWEFLELVNAPDNKKLHILITSQMVVLLPGVKTFPLHELSRSDVVKLTKKGLGIEDKSQDKDIEQLLKQLHNFPLGIMQVIACIKEKNMEGKHSARNFPNNFKIKTRKPSRCKRIMAWVDNPYKKVAYVTWKIAVDRIGSHELLGETALRILKVISYLAPYDIRTEIFSPFVKTDDENIKSAIRLLTRYSMIYTNEDETLINVHQLVQDMTRLQIGKEEENDIIKLAASSLLDTEQAKDDTKQAEDHAIVREALPHYESLLKHLRRLWEEPNAIKDIGNLCSVISILTATLANAKRLTRLEEILNEALTQAGYGSNHDDVAEVLTGLSKAYETHGDVERAKRLLERVKVIQEKHYGENHVKLAVTLGHLGSIYKGLGENEKGKELLERALMITEKHDGLDDDEMATILTKLAVYFKFGYFEKQTQLLERALAIRQRIYRPNHYIVARTMAKLSMAYRNSGNYVGHKDVLEGALTIFEKHYGPDHWEVESTMGNLGIVYGLLGNAVKKKESTCRILF